METRNGIPVFYAKERADWRKWLEKNCQSQQAVWLLIYHKKSKKPSIYYQDAIEESLCFGWIDSKANKRDDESFYLYFTQRKPKGNWSLVNKERAERMIREGKMTPYGQAFIDLARQTGTWDALDSAQQTLIPPDLQKLFNKNKMALKNFRAFPPSSQRMILEWITTAKKPETRAQRIAKTVELAAANIKAR